MADRENRMEELGAAFLNSLVQKHVMLRRVGTEQFYFGVGCVADQLGIGWPARMLGDHRAMPDTRKHHEFLLILNPDEWEAVSISFRSPLWQAVDQERHSHAPAASGMTEVDVKETPPFPSNT